MKKEVYLDYNSTTPIDPRVKEKYLEALEIFGNPSNVYKYGRDAKKQLEQSRKTIAEIFNVDKNTIIFTCGGTMANNISIFGLSKVYGKEKRHIICSMIEHPSCLNTVRELERSGYKVTYLPVDRYGVVRLDILEKSITSETFLIVCMAVNNETGSIQPIEEIAKLAREKNILFHCDSVQVVGKEKINLDNVEVTTFSASAHKFYGPKGVGFLYLREGVKLGPIIFGGHQEREIFPGTENLPSIISMAYALELSYLNIEEEKKREYKIKNMIYENLINMYPNLKLNGSFDKCVANTLNVSFVGKLNTEIINKLDNLGVYAGTGSACKTSEDTPSHVLLAMGLSKIEYQGAVRISIGRFTKEEDVPEIIEAFREAIK